MDQKCNFISKKCNQQETESVYWPTIEEPVQVCEVDDLKYVIELVKPVSSTDSDKQLILKQEFEITEYKVSLHSFKIFLIQIEPSRILTILIFYQKLKVLGPKQNQSGSIHSERTMA